jgi:hypothetical protein
VCLATIIDQVGVALERHIDGLARAADDVAPPGEAEHVLGFGYPWELIATLAGAAISVYGLVGAALSERILRRIAKDVRGLATRRSGLRRRLSDLVRRVCRRPSWQQPPA